ncbi:MAG: TetR/AcrR family transcriptional regulator [Streptococcus sp.]|nr:TetR/AcrR family transcriptional regulator [Streptococcus sp.]
MKKQRRTLSKKYIKEAFTLLLKEEPFETISVTAICKKAGVNRGTFYLHYVDKYDLIDKLKEEVLNELDEIKSYSNDIFEKSFIYRTLHYMYENYDFLSVIYQSSEVRFSQTVYDYIHSVISKTSCFDEILVKNYDIPLYYAKILYVSGLQSLIIAWIENGCQESPEEMSDIVYTTFNPAT